MRTLMTLAVLLLLSPFWSSLTAQAQSSHSAAFVGRWTMNKDMYVEALHESQKKLEPGVLENYTKLFGEEAARDRLEKLQKGQLERARNTSLQFDLGADGAFTGRLGTKSSRGPTDFQGHWIVWPKGVILFDTEVLQPGMKEPSPALGWILAMECDSDGPMRLSAGRLGLIGRARLEFARSDPAAAGKSANFVRS